MCDNIAAAPSATLSGTVLFGKNSDREYNEAQFLQMLPAARHEPGASVRLTYKEIEQARETHAVLLSKPHWIWGAEIGANEHGLTIGNEAIYSRIEPSMEPGIIGMDYIRLALERAKTVEEAIHTITTLLREHGQSGKAGFKREIAYHNSYLLADAKGIKILETVDREWVVKPVEDYDAISNAITIEQFAASSPTLQARAAEAGLTGAGGPLNFRSVFASPAKIKSSLHRRTRARKLLGQKSGSLQLTDFFAILRDHEEGVNDEGARVVRICAHRKENPLGQTTGSLVADLTPGKRVYWVTGTAAPCTSVFKPVMFETGLPDHGPLPGAQEEAVSLWWRHERIRQGLDHGSDEVRQAFNAERDALEARFLEKIGRCPPVTDTQGREAAYRAVTECWQEGIAFENTWHGRLAESKAAS